MRNALANEQIRKAQDRAVERRLGVSPVLFATSASRAAEISIADLSQLPVDAPDVDAPLQTESGAMVFLLGYSHIGMGDVFG